MEKTYYALTGPQKNIWQLEQISQNNSSLNTIYTVLKLPKNIDLKLLDKTLNKIRELNDSIRIRFTTNKMGEVMQFVDDFKYIPSRIIYAETDDISNVIEREKEDKLSVFEKVNELAIVKTPNFCFVLYKTHHILSDGWGMTQVADQIKDIYCKYEQIDELRKLQYKRQ